MNNTVDFDRIDDRRNTHASKWNGADERFGGTDVIPMFVADMDFRSPDCIVDALQKRVEHGFFGYSDYGDSYFDAVIAWQKRIHHNEITKEQIIPVSGVITGLHWSVHALCKPQDGCIISTPVYGAFFSVPNNNHLTLLENDLLLKEGRWEIDFEDFEKKAALPTTTAFILCNPHNPVGRVWTKEELIKLLTICNRNHVFVFADEIHQDIIMPEVTYTSVAELDESLLQNTVLLTAPSKTFNLPGLQTSNIIVRNPQLKARIEQHMAENHVVQPGVLGVYALIAGYNEGADWVDAMCRYVDDNFSLMERFFNERLPQIKFIRPQATYLAWLDCRALGMNCVELERFFGKAGVGLSQGTIFGATSGEGYMRLTAACPRSVLQEALIRMERAVCAL